MTENKQAIVVVSFGTMYEDTRRSCIEAVENRIRDTFPEYQIYRAFTSKFIIKRLAIRDKLYIDDLPTVLDRLEQEGYTEVIVQTTHLTPGEEYEKKILAIIQPYENRFLKFSVGRPLLYFAGEEGKPDDFAMVIPALRSQIPADLPDDHAIVFMGHGSPNQHNPAYERIQQYLDQEKINAVVGVVEETDYPNFSDMQKLLEKRKIKKILLMPLLLVAGDHAKNDMAGEDKESWSNRFIAQGYEVAVYLHGLGENKLIQDIYVQHVRDAIADVK